MRMCGGQSPLPVRPRRSVLSEISSFLRNSLRGIISLPLSVTVTSWRPLAAAVSANGDSGPICRLPARGDRGTGSDRARRLLAGVGGLSVNENLRCISLRQFAIGGGETRHTDAETSRVRSTTQTRWTRLLRRCRDPYLSGLNFPDEEERHR